MGLPKCVATGDEGNRLFVVHGHSLKCLADIPGRRQRIRHAVRTFWIDVNKAHLHSAQRINEFTIAVVALIAEPRGLGAPINVLLGSPNIFSATGEAKCFETHRLQRNVAGEDHQVGPGEFATILLLDRQQ